MATTNANGDLRTPVSRVDRRFWEMHDLLFANPRAVEVSVGLKSIVHAIERELDAR
jgi:hypothetical protein